MHVETDHRDYILNRDYATRAETSCGGLPFLLHLANQ